MTLYYASENTYPALDWRPAVTAATRQLAEAGIEQLRLETTRKLTAP
jgi:hypothetical protein